MVLIDAFLNRLKAEKMGKKFKHHKVQDESNLFLLNQFSVYFQIMEI